MDPILQTGLESARRILNDLKEVPVQLRPEVMQNVLSAIDPTLPDRTASTSRRFQRMGLPAEDALEAALGSEIASGIVKELVRLGKAQRSLSGALGSYFLRGLGSYFAPGELGGWTDFVGRQVKRVTRPVARVVSREARQTGSDVASWTTRMVRKTVNGVQDAGCKLVGNSTATTAATVAAGAKGGAGAAASAQQGIAVAQGMCATTAPAAASTPLPPPPPPSPYPPWAPYAGVGFVAVFGVLVLAIIAKKKKQRS